MHPLDRAQAEEAAAKELSRTLTGCLGWASVAIVVLIIAVAIIMVVR